VEEIASNAFDPTIVKMIEDNIAAFYMRMGRTPGAELHTEPDLTWIATSIPSAAFNGVLQTRLPSDASGDEIGSRIDELVATFADRTSPMVWWVTPSTTPANLETYLLARGFSALGPRPGMAIDLDTLSQPTPQISGIEITTVADVSTYETWGRIFAASYGHQLEVAQRYFDSTSPLIESEGASMRHYLAWHGGSPVAISTLFVSDGVAGLYHVGALPEARGQGIGTAIVLAPLLEARARGLRHAVLYSSLMGVNIYRRLGFKVYCQLHRYTHPAPQTA
jgi:GNAT superfamily N-acetyltransferase